MPAEDHHTESPTDGEYNSGWVRIDEARTLDDESAIHLDIGRHEVCLIRSLGRIHAIRDECTHGQVLLSEGDIEAGYVECWLHGSRFDLDTGVPTGPPATEPVAVYPVRMTDNEIQVRLPTSDD
ncbi:non-heme iron oxygenase ferredoxin subunit [Brevibacterium antiquum]|uniref:non-heme iron oxygenase ferredoxin subunit n=1 Tax=Brevibacterium antiquum TaxID=234835 RepID=UPI0018DEF3DB|nr:non-heme iron oxygenase ferredoxin subunit [Brevibacterium antiquum]